MEEEITREMLRQAPFGCAYHRILLDEQGKVQDAIFLDVNPVFEEMIGLKSQTIVGERVTEVFSSMKNGEFNWVDFYKRIASFVGRQEFTQYIEPLKRWYKVTVFAPKKEHFIAIFQDVTSEVERIKALEDQKRQIKELTAELETIFNATQDAMFMVKVENGEFRYIRNNVVHQKLVGYSLEEIKGKTSFEVMGEELGAIVTAGYQKCVQAKAPVTYEETLSFPAGERTWLTALTPVLENGEVKYLVGSRKDITLQKRAEKEREELLHRLQAMFNEHTAIMLLIEPISGKIIDANPAACDFYGYTRQELLNMYIQDINILPKEEVERRRLMALQEKQRYFVFPHRLKNGEIRMVDVYSCPITYYNEKLLFSIIFDVTDRERYKEELHEEKELLRTTLLSIGDGVVTTDAEGRITVLNPAAEEITGWSEEETRGRLFTEIFKLLSDDTGKEVENPIAKVLTTGKIIGLANHTALIAKDGRKIPIADSAAPIKDEAGQIFGVVMVFRDITEEKAWQEEILNLSYRDVLTGLYNRRFIEEQSKRLEAARELPVAVIMADINGLKLANDVFGHEEGDRLLKKAAEILTGSCRKEDIIARWGGDEFLIILPHIDAKIAEEVIDRIKNKCLQIKGGKTQLSIAMGYAVKTQSSESLGQVIKEAEEWMYRRKLMEGRSYRNTIINTLLSTLHAKSIETEEHAERLKNWCLAIGTAMKLSTKELDELALLAVLHDIGKVGIKESILQKPGPLTEEEWREMKRHPEIGFRIAQNTSELAHIAEYILFHHEHWDGSGYPRGLKGEEIPLLCRILAVADAYDAMISDRSYRKALSEKEAIDEIRRNAGTQFDPKVSDVFSKIIADGAY